MPGEKAHIPHKEVPKGSKKPKGKGKVVASTSEEVLKLSKEEMERNWGSCTSSSPPSTPRLVNSKSQFNGCFL